MKQFTKKQKKYLDLLSDKIGRASNIYWLTIEVLEKEAKEDLKIPIEAFHVDGSFVGFGDYGRKYKLYQRK